LYPTINETSRWLLRKKILLWYGQKQNIAVEKKDKKNIAIEKSQAKYSC